MSRVLVLGVGNPLMGDDGIGQAALERLRADWELPANVELADGGTWGMQLIPAIEAADEVVIVDAIAADRPVGTVVRMAREDLPRLFKMRVSPHHVDLEDVLALLEFRGSAPERIWAVGIVPGPVDWGIGLSDPVAERIPELAAAVVADLQERGFDIVPRAEEARR
ncbi:MAG: HyaD/HybD family hydrogenase maturation endopeptidase [Gemmatimonadales bacterium]